MQDISRPHTMDIDSRAVTLATANWLNSSFRTNVAARRGPAVRRSPYVASHSASVVSDGYRGVRRAQPQPLTEHAGVDSVTVDVSGVGVAVAMGSRALAGSSMSTTSGSTARARAIEGGQPVRDLFKACAKTPLEQLDIIARPLACAQEAGIGHHDCGSEIAGEVPAIEALALCVEHVVEGFTLLITVPFDAGLPVQHWRLDLLAAAQVGENVREADLPPVTGRASHREKRVCDQAMAVHRCARNRLITV